MKSLRQSSLGTTHEYKLHLMKPLEFETEFLEDSLQIFDGINFDATRMRQQFVDCLKTEFAGEYSQQQFMFWESNNI